MEKDTKEPDKKDLHEPEKPKGQKISEAPADIPPLEVTKGEPVPKSRLSKTAVAQTKKTIFLAIAGIAAIGILLVLFGMPILINLSLLFEKSTDGNEKKSLTDEYIPPPVLNPMAIATNSAEIDINGQGQKESTIILYVNDTKVDEKEIGDDNQFTFRGVKLDEGDNFIKTKTKLDQDKISAYSEELKIAYLKKPPTLELQEPQDGKTFDKDRSPIEVKGKTDPKVKVTVNGFWAIVDTNGNFSYNLPLQGGENTIKITATDEAGNKTEKEVKVSYSQ